MTDESKQPETTLSRRDETAIAHVSAAPASLGDIMATIKEAALSKADAEVMRELHNIYREAKADHAREVHANAKVQFRRLLKPIIMTGLRDDTKIKNARGEYGSVKYPYAELTTTIEQIQPMLDQCGLTPTWRMTKSEPTYVEVECIITSSLGHEESSGPFGSPVGEGRRGQTPVQVRQGVVTTLKRVTLFAVLGLTTMEDDRALGDAEQGQDEKKPATQELLDADPDERAAKARFREVANERAGAVLPNQALHKLLAAVRDACGEQDVATCVRWLEQNDVHVGKEGSLGVVTEDPSAFDSPLTPEDVAAAVDAAVEAAPEAGGVAMCKKGHTIARADIVPSTLVNSKKGELGLCPVCKKAGTASIVKEK